MILAVVGHEEACFLGSNFTSDVKNLLVDLLRKRGFWMSKMATWSCLIVFTKFFFAENVIQTFFNVVCSPVAGEPRQAQMQKEFNFVFATLQPWCHPSKTTRAVNLWCMNGVCSTTKMDITFPGKETRLRSFYFVGAGLGPELFVLNPPWSNSYSKSERLSTICSVIASWFYLPSFHAIVHDNSVLVSFQPALWKYVYS